MGKIIRTSKTQQPRKDKIILHRIRTDIKYECGECHEDLEECSRCDYNFDTDSMVFCDSDKCEHLCEKCASKLVKK